MAPTRRVKEKKKKGRSTPYEKRKKYTEEQMLSALDAVNSGVPVATAARKFGVPRITLYYKSNGKYPISCKPGPESVLTGKEEDALVLWILSMCQAGFPVTGEQLRDSVQYLMKTELKRNSPFIDGRPGKKWLQNFKNRHPSISERICENLTISRASVGKDEINGWFEKTTQYLHDNSLLDVLKDPQRVFNGDETAFFLNPKGKRVLAPKGAKNIYLNVSNDEKECITVLITANANGDLAPPMVVFKYERVPDIIAESIPDGWGLGKSENGWMTGATFYEYFTKLFEPWLEKIGIPRPVIFFMDGHSSHLTYHLTEFCMKNSIVLIALPPNTTHIMQPMDVSVFRSLKENWRTKVHDWRVQRINQPNQMLKKKDFCPLLNEVISAIHPSIIRNGFKKCGLLPWDVNAVKCDVSSQELPAQANVPSVSDIQKSLEILERFIGEETVKLFKNSPRGTGNIEDSSLLMVWKRMRRYCCLEPNDETAQKEQAESTEKVPAQPEHNALHDSDPPQAACVDDQNYSHEMSDPGKKTTLPVPSPFKRALSWPEPPVKSTKNNKREVIPSVVTSTEYKSYLKRKMDKKKEEEERKKERACERARKKTEKEQIKLQKDEERQTKKAMAQSKKKKPRAKKTKKVPETSSEDEEEWVPDRSDEEENRDEVEETPEDLSEIVLLDVQFNDSTLAGMDEPLSFNVFNGEDNFNDIKEQHQAILQSIEEAIGEPIQSPIYPTEEQNNQDLRGNEEPNDLEERREVSIRKGQGLTKEDEMHKNDITFREGDYVMALKCVKKKRIRVACTILKITEGQVVAKRLKPLNRLKSVFTLVDGEIQIDQNNIVSLLPKPLVFGNAPMQRLLFPDSLELD